MPTLIYSPAVRVRIATTANGIVDITDDIASGTVHLAPKGQSYVNFSLVNNKRKYDGVFTPMDRITVAMKRISWVQVFAGYLDEVPYFNVYPRSVSIRASDTLKVLRHFLWDSGTEEAWNLLHVGKKLHGGEEIDGGLRDRAIRLLTKVAGWERERILGQGLVVRRADRSRLQQHGPLRREWIESEGPLVLRHALAVRQDGCKDRYAGWLPQSE
jgi:hypothetical protein